MKKVLLVVLALVISSATLFAAGETFSNFDSAGTDAQSVAISGMQSWKWVVGFIPLGFGLFSAFKVNEYLNQKDESGGGQTEPKATRYAKVLGAGIVGILVIYILLGLLGAVFADKTFTETWKTFVVDFWSQLF